MYKLIATATGCLFWFQTNAQDLVIMLNRDSLNVVVTKNAPDVVEYKYENETAINVVEKSNIHKIIFASGRVEICNERRNLPAISGKKDWEKVIITFDENDVLGLSECGTVTVSSASGYVGAAFEKGESAKKQMMKKAAELGAPIVLVLEGWNKEKNKPIVGFAGSVTLSGKAYK